jgi:hypothetical protein
MPDSLNLNAPISKKAKTASKRKAIVNFSKDE